MEIEKLKVGVKNDDDSDAILTVDPRLALMSQPLAESDSSEVIMININRKVFEKILVFYEIYDYSTEELQKLPNEIKSDNLLKNIGEKNYQYFSEYLEAENTLNLEKLKPLVSACYQYNFKYLWDLCKTVLGTDFYCEATEEGLEGLKRKFNLPELNDEEIFEIIDENKEAFDALHEQFVKYLNGIDIKEGDFSRDDMD